MLNLSVLHRSLGVRRIASQIKLKQKLDEGMMLSDPTKSKSKVDVKIEDKKVIK